MIRKKIAEILNVIRENPVLNPEVSSTEYIALESWLHEAEDAESAEYLETINRISAQWKRLMARMEKAVVAERQRWEEEKKKWGGYSNPYIREVSELMEKQNKVIQNQTFSKAFPICHHFIKGLGQESLHASFERKKFKYSMSNQHFEKIQEMFNTEYMLNMDAVRENIKGGILKRRENVFAGWQCIQSDDLQFIQFKSDERTNYQFQPEEDRYSEYSRPADPMQKLIVSNFVKTLRAPTIVLMTGAFIYSILFGGNLRELLNTAFKDYPVTLWFFILILLLYFYQTTHNDIRRYLDARKEDRQRIWSQFKGNFKSDIGVLFNNQKNELKEFISRITESEKEWLTAIWERYMSPELEARLMPPANAAKYLTGADMEMTRLFNEAQRASALSHRNAHRLNS